MAADSIWTPLAYVLVLLGALVVFSKHYRARRSRRATEHLYPHNYAKDIFQSLLEQSSSTTIPPKLMKAALLGWGAEDMARAYRMRDSEPVITALHERERVGDAFFDRFGGSKKATEAELGEIAAVSRTLEPKWDHVLQTAMEIAQQDAVRRRMDELDAFKEEYRAFAGRTVPAAPEETPAAADTTESPSKGKKQNKDSTAANS